MKPINILHGRVDHCPSLVHVAAMLFILLTGAFFIPPLAKENSALAAFNAACEINEFDQVIHYGAKLTKKFPDDNLILLKYCHALFRKGEFTRLLKRHETFIDWIMLPDTLSSIDELGAQYADYSNFKLQLFALAATGKLDLFMAKFDKVTLYPDPELHLLRYFVLRQTENDGAADTVAKYLFSLPHYADANVDLIAQRIFPVFRTPSLHDSLQTSSCSVTERTLLTAAAGFSLALAGRIDTAKALLGRALDEENPGVAFSLPVTLYSMLFHELPETKKRIARSCANPAWAEQTRLFNRFVEAYYTNGDYIEASSVISKLRTLAPYDLDYACQHLLLHMMLGRWSSADSTAQKILAKNPWNSENVICTRIYSTLLHLLQNDKKQYSQACSDLEKLTVPDPWRRVIAAMIDTVRIPQTLDSLALQPGCYAALLIIRALQSEARGDYISAEASYMEIISREELMKYLEYQLAEQRLRVVAPFGAMQRMQ